jgi:hypothetical protein
MGILGQEGLSAPGFETRWVRVFKYPSVTAPRLTHTPVQSVPRVSLSLSLCRRSKAAGVWTNLSVGRAIPVHLIHAFVGSYRVTLTKTRSLL